MDPAAIVQEGREQEAARLAFLETHRGLDAAYAFARQTLRVYRRAVLGRATPAGLIHARCRHGPAPQSRPGRPPGQPASVGFRVMSVLNSLDTGQIVLVFSAAA